MKLETATLVSGSKTPAGDTLAPDSAKARQGVLEALAQAQPPQIAAETADFAGKPPATSALACRQRPPRHGPPPTPWQTST